MERSTEHSYFHNDQIRGVTEMNSEGVTHSTGNQLKGVQTLKRVFIEGPSLCTEIIQKSIL